MASGDDTGFRPLPGDPWAPEPSSESDPAPAGESVEEAGEEPTDGSRKRLFGRRRRRGDEVESETSDDEDPAPEAEPPPASDEPDDPTLTVDLPPWAEGGTSGAEHVEAGFNTDDDLVPADPDFAGRGYLPPTVLPEEGPSAEEESTLTEATTETVALLEEEVPAEPVASGDEETPVAAIDASEEPPGGDRRDDQESAPAGPYGVAGPEAFSALHDDELGDLDDWAAFAGEAASRPEPSAEVEDSDVEDAPEPSGRPRRRLFGRGARLESEGSLAMGEDTDEQANDQDESVPALQEVEGGEFEGATDSEGSAEPRRRGLFRRRRIVSEATHSNDDPAAAMPKWREESPVYGDSGDESWPEVAGSVPGAEMADGGDDDIFLPSAGDEVVDGESYEPAMSEPDDSGWFDEGAAEVPGVTSSDREERGGDGGDWVTGPVAVDPDRTMELDDPVGASMTDDSHARAATMEHRGLADEIDRLGAEDTDWQAMAAVMPGVESGVVGFEDVADLSTGEGYREGPRSDMGARLATGLVLAVFLFGSLFVGGAAMAVFVGILAVVGIGELFATLRRVGLRPLTPLGILAGAGLFATTWFHGPIAIAIAIGLLTSVVFFVLAFGPLREDALVNGGLTVMAVVWVVGTMAFAFPILQHPDFRPLVLALVLATAAMDMGAFTFGRAWGRRALAPVLSPNKSVEGLVGGVIAAVAAGAIFGALYEPFDLRSGLALGLLVAVMAPMGDLAESMVKRSLGVKDMGTILPGHGGILDRVDAFLFVIPAVWVLYRSIGLLG